VSAAEDSSKEEVLAAFHQYEKALMEGDVAAMTDVFIDSAELVRFGISDLQIGAQALTEWRRRQPPLPAGRRLFDTRVMAVGPDTAVVTTLFDYPGQSTVGRQSQTWVRSEAGWQVVHAHVSVVERHLP
jgi:ketosteroid isomerase-like protein